MGALPERIQVLWSCPALPAFCLTFNLLKHRMLTITSWGASMIIPSPPALPNSRAKPWTGGSIQSLKRGGTDLQHTYSVPCLLPLEK